MSFYGSVYYQLIDTFYKVIMRNKGKESSTFISEEELEDTEVQAVGRKGVFGLDTGNRWINLKCVEEDRPDAKEQYSIYEIYHGAPCEENVSPNHGFKAIVDVDQRIDEEGVIQLDFHDKFETYESIYDEAGHIVETSRKLYRLPKGEVNDRVDRLEQLVGTNENRTNLPKKDDPEDENLYGYVEDNCDDIKKLKWYTGDWTKDAAKYWTNPDEAGADKLLTGYAPTIAQVVGDLNLMYDNEFSNRANNFKSLSEIIGNLYEMYNSINGSKESPISLSSAISKIQSNLKSSVEQIQNSITGIHAQIGKPIDEAIDIYEHIKANYSSIENIEDILDWADKNNTTVSDELDDLDGRVEDLELYRQELSGVTLPAMNLSIETLQTQTGEHYAIWEEASEEFEKTHEDIYSKMGSVPDNDNIINIISTTEEDLLAIIGEVPQDSTVMSEMASQKEVFESLIGEVPEGSSVISVINDNQEAIETLIGEIPEGSSVAGEFEKIQNDIDTIELNLGTNPAEDKTAFGLIANNATAIEDINNIIGTIEEGTTVADLIATIHTDMGEKVDDKSLSARISSNTSAIATLTTETLPGYVTKQQIQEANYAATTHVEAVQEAVEEIIGSLENASALKENITTESQNLLEDIFARLVSLESDIKSIKTVVNGLHSDGEPPFPEVVEQEPEEKPLPEDPEQEPDVEDPEGENTIE